MSASLILHDEIMRSTIEDNGGNVFSTAGDSFAAAFATVGQAVAAAMESQLALERASWEGPAIRVRMGIHIGSAEERDGDYFGPDVSRSARIMSAANGGQILASTVVARLLDGADEAPALVDHGVHDLEGFERSERIFELVHPDLPEVTTPIRAAPVGRSHLPAQLSSFVGRNSELEAISEMLQTARIVTLAGVGGTGKTRLAIEAGSRIASDYPDGVWMVELAPVSDPDLVEAELAGLWNLRASDGAGLLRVVTSYIGSRRMLIVVDNCEHLLKSSAELCEALLRACPNLVILATSRESLGVAGETVYRVPSLSLTDSVGERSDAIDLYLRRAVERGIEVEADEMETVAWICRRLDGIPVGIELAAAMLRTLSVGELADRLRDSFRILTGGSKAAVPRQRTLQTTIDWSYQLLDEDVAALFRRLSVFTGGFDLDAAEVVGSGGGIERWKIVGLVDQLVDKSLVVATHGSVRTRFHMLEPIRHYGQDRLAGSGEGLETFLAHARHYMAVAAKAETPLSGPEQRTATGELIEDIDNMRLALSTLLDAELFDEYLTGLFKLTRFWMQSGLLLEARAMLDAGLSAGGNRATPGVVARGYWSAALISTMLSDVRAIDLVGAGLNVARAAGDDGMVGWLTLMEAGIRRQMWGPTSETERLRTEGETLIWENPQPPLIDEETDPIELEYFLIVSATGNAKGDEEALDAAVELALDAGDLYTAASLLSMSGFISRDIDWKLERLRRSVEIFEELEFRHGLGHGLYFYGENLEDRSPGAGTDDLARGSEILAELGDIQCSVWASTRLIDSLVESGDLQSARSHLAVSLGRLVAFDRELEPGFLASARRYAYAIGQKPPADMQGETVARRQIVGWLDDILTASVS